MFDADPVALLAREVLRERTAALVAESCAWSVGLSDSASYVRRHGRVVATGQTIGSRASAGLPLSGDEDVPLELAEAVPGSFGDVLGALTADGTLVAERFEAEVLVPFVLQTCVEAAQRARAADPRAWEELLDDLGEDGSDLEAVARAAEWDAPLRVDAEVLVVAALGTVPLVEVEAEGLPLSLVRAAESFTRQAAPTAERTAPQDAAHDELAGARFLAEVALANADLEQPVQAAYAPAVLEALLGEGLDLEEVERLLPFLPLAGGAATALLLELEVLRARRSCVRTEGPSRMPARPSGPEARSAVVLCRSTRCPVPVRRRPASSGVRSSRRDAVLSTQGDGDRHGSGSP